MLDSMVWSITVATSEVIGIPIRIIQYVWLQSTMTTNYTVLDGVGSHTRHYGASHSPL